MAHGLTVEAAPGQSPPRVEQANPAVASTPLSTLVDELMRQNPDVLAARSAATAASYVAPQVSSLPDPRVTVQQMNVGNPLPFAGYTSNNFAYLAVGISQALPYPGKRALRADVARGDADVATARIDVVSRDQIEELKKTYARLAYSQAALANLERDNALLQQVEQQAHARYASGQGNQQDVLRAQLERTTILREMSLNRQASGEAQAEVKRLVRRAQDSPDIVTEALAATFLRQTRAELLDAVRAGNPDVREQSAAVTRNQTAVALAEKEFRPDFGVAFMYQNTGPAFPDYYMATFDVTFHRHAPRDAALAQARVNVDRADQQRDAALQTALADAQRQYVIAKTAEEQLLIYRDGLIPQAQATIQAGLAAYQANREDFQTLLASFVDVLTLDLQYQQTLLDHETALARLERLTGVALR
ncbi:MAG: TolC family protein [Acidobacteria bacterium]|nr:TolC family protein [Acidobacteriota bacterium]